MNFNMSLLDRLRWRLKLTEARFQNYRLTTNETETATTEYGVVKGCKRNTVYGDSYFSFEGIPYAQPPLGELRFKAPQRPVPWEGVRDCCTHKDKAVQTDFASGKSSGSEDCLYLNVYTTKTNPETKRPVLVFIHGGGFIVGEANREWTGADYFMKKDVVVVTIQYRLGVFGFLSLKSEELNVPGNAGLKDQVMALRWVKNNIANFGGDPECITVFGESAGGASTHYMMITEQTRGLFHRAVLMSGNALCSWAHSYNQHQPYAIAKLVGYKGKNDDKDVLEYLNKLNPYDLARVEHTVLTPDEMNNSVMFAFGPTTEPYASADCVVPKHPREMVKTAWGNSIPTMMGCTSYEGLLWLSALKQFPHMVNELESCTKFLPRELVEKGHTSPETMELADALKKIHVAGDAPCVDNYLDICSFTYFWVPMHRLLQLRFNHTAGAPVYLYRFDFDSEEIIHPYRYVRYGRGVKGVSHGDELSYLLWTFMARRLPKESREYKTIERTVGIWAQFAATGNPYSQDIDGMKDLTWEPLKKSDQIYKCLNISDELKIMDLPEMEKIKKWEALFEKKKELF